MSNNLKTFLIVLAVVLVASGGLIYVSAKNKFGADAKSNQSADNSSGQPADTGTNSNSDFSASYLADLAKFMTAQGMVMYGAYWCPHCQEQKKDFGDALQYITYVECDPKGENANPDACAAKNITAYPTWIYQGQKVDSNGKLVPISAAGGTGALSINQLAGIVGFTEQN